MPIKYVSKTEFKSQALELFRHIQETGERVVVTDQGNPTIQVLPYRSTGDRTLALLRGSVLKYVEPLRPVDVDWLAGE